MARGVASNPLMLSLEAAVLLLVAAGVPAAALRDDMDAIRVPTHVRGVADLVTAVARATKGDDEKRPWKCCDLAMCMRSWPPICRCLDEVERCSGACRNCEETGDSRRTCVDWYKGQPGPQCHHKDAAERQAAAAADAEKKGGDEKRPWKCCSLPICTRSQPPICHCWDEVKRCSSACVHCEVVEGSSGGPRRYRCLDTHHGDPGPRCREKQWAPTVATSYRF
ncbi:hypothetical protein SEVIR_5G085000v4 [Setaria viridis]|uniref:Bowman-Birk serine protease inhibitors family domain-containing protein n=2 Tax=Setaria TaxID=4554 RepID=K3XLQ3_SETIT|nr:Bowman-Birk type trypsin inhibitor [Setaria italica]XP_034598168.1 Bowman-Birk type trypsin inhibitor-like [Setaria viridis]RCV24466.1 hypothetical protein SETIT_5G086800v2 [Setaria italica]TKW13211.1 hypothetical protein SEVIR_5G085000v2 [Setaria viridis]